MSGPEQPDIDPTDTIDAGDVAGVSPEQLAAAVVAGHARVTELEGKLSDATARLRSVSKAYTDLQADQDAYRIRTNALMEQKAERKAAEAVEAFFDPVQNLERSIAAAPAGTDEGMLTGLKMVHQQFRDAMTRLGLERIPSNGADFDPLIHEALALTPVDDPRLDGKVLIVHSEGWRVKGKVIQPAQVIVGKHEPPPAVADDGEEAPAPPDAPNGEPEA